MLRVLFDGIQTILTAVQKTLAGIIRMNVRGQNSKSEHLRMAHISSGKRYKSYILLSLFICSSLSSLLGCLRFLIQIETRQCPTGKMFNIRNLATLGTLLVPIAVSWLVCRQRALAEPDIYKKRKGGESTQQN
jgi:hypothetical protein